MADDLRLASGGCEVTYYSLEVFGQGTPGAPTTFSVQTELWDGDPCFGTSSIIPGSQQVFSALTNDGQTASLLEVTLPAPAEAPATVWLAATFSINDAGWIIAERAEVGSTGDFWSEDDATFGCAQLAFGPPNPPYAGFWATVNCNVAGDPTGACCDGTACTEVTESVCIGSGGTWLGAFTDCEPNPCLLGACCSGEDFTVCADSTEADCPADRAFFRPGATCDQNPCQLAFKVYENDFLSGFFSTPATLGETWADDLRLSAGAPCELAGYSLITVGDTTVSSYHVQASLYTNNDHGTTIDETDDTPLAPITGTQTTFGPLSGGLEAQSLLAGPFDGIDLPEKVWLVVTVTNVNSGPLFAGIANIGSSRDAFAATMTPSNPDAWTIFNQPFGGYNPDTCPGGENCNPAGSFDADVWCYGEPPSGACCNDAAATCVDGVPETQCDGRWVPLTTCDADPSPFNPGCGLSACCTQFGCTNRLPAECEALGIENNIPVAIARGKLCAGVTCPRASCLDATGDCFAVGSTPGCDDPFCCEAVCAADDPCCSDVWDSPCVVEAGQFCTQSLANDHCELATEISGVGSFDFDTTTATTDGAPHAACLDLGDQEHILHDVWYCWTAPCNDYVMVSTCGQTDSVDTKIAVYDGCDTCAPTDSELIACNDDACTSSFESQVVFRATVGEKKLIRVGTFPGSSGGTGQFSITCGVPANAACPATGDCCGDNGTAACTEANCCDLVCACDPACCENGWDAACAGTGSPRSGFGCGAAVLCDACRRAGDVSWNGLLDLNDWAMIQELCFHGPAVQNGDSLCGFADTDANGTSDLRDFVNFATGFDGP